MEPVLKYNCVLSVCNLSICHCRELLVIGGVAAKEQLAALEQGVCDMNCL